MHRALHVRTTVDGREIGRDELDPLLWPGSTYLFDLPRSSEVLRALDLILSADPTAMIEDPLRRALFQRDLWAVFDALVGIEDSGDAGARAPGTLIETVRAAQLPEAARTDVAVEVARSVASRRDVRRALVERLARTLRRVALEPAELATLPDNFALAVRADAEDSRGGATADERALLPADLLDPSGPWVLVAADGDELGEPFAGAHASAFSGRSSFAVHVRLPGGRAATREWLRALGELDPLAGECPATCDPRTSVARAASEATPTAGGAVERHGHYARSLLHVPSGTAFALVRRMLLFDRTGELHATPIVESVQVRTVVRDGAPANGAAFDAASWKPFQSVSEHELERVALLSGVRGGLVATSPDERKFPTFGAHGFDLVEAAPIWETVTLDTCFACHGQPGMLATNSYTRSMSGPGSLASMPVRSSPARWVETFLADVSSTALRYKRERDDWRRLRAILRDDARESEE